MPATDPDDDVTMPATDGDVTMTATDPDGAWQRLDRRAALVAAVYTAGFVVVAAVVGGYWIAVGTGSVGVALAWVLPGGAVVVGAGAGAGEWMWQVTRYRVRPELLEVHTGVVFRRRLSLRRERIRSVDLSADPVLRAFRLVNVRIGTGEQAGAEGTVTLWPVRRPVAESLRADLLAHAAKHSDDSRSDDRLATFDPRWVRYAPLSFLTPLLGVSAAGLVLEGADAFGYQVAVIGWIGSLFDGASVPVVIAVLLALSLAVGAVATTALWAEMWWSYRLDREPGGTLRVRRGLLTTRSVSLDEKRIRGVELVEPLGVRLAGGARVDAVATGLATAAEDKSESRTLQPAAPRGRAVAVAADVLRTANSPIAAPLVAHPTAARARRLRWALAGALALVAVLALLGALLTDVLLHLAWISAVVAVPVALLLGGAAYRALGHALPEEYLVARSGAVRRSTVALQRRGIVGWNVRQSYFQRRAGLLTVTATTAAGSGGYAVRDSDGAAGLALADAAVPGLLAPFLVGPPVGDDRP